MPKDKKSKHRKALDAAMGRNDLEEYDRLQSEESAYQQYKASEEAKQRAQYDKKMRIVREHMGERDYKARGEQMQDPWPVKSYMDTYREMSQQQKLGARDAILAREREQARRDAMPPTSDYGLFGKQIPLREPEPVGDDPLLKRRDNLMRLREAADYYGSRWKAPVGRAHIGAGEPLSPEEEAQFQSLLSRRKQGMR